ncbi:MAG: beta-N-acetylhexosaminidase [Deltaproteobacteria bacterium]|nr:beta-N-acetylhexosaminidase [Deltaproteobacteria bacterium]
MTDPLAGLILCGFPGLDADSDDVRARADLGVGGWIVFGRNVESPAQVGQLLRDLGALSPTPPLLALDQEGGRVARLRAPLTVWPPMGVVGATDDPGLAESVGRALASEIRAVGFNLDFAPCVDVNSHAENPVIGDRAFGSDSGTVRRLAIPFLRGLHSTGMAGSAKHFPGHGHVDVDSHYGLPVCHLSREELEPHLAPFRDAVAAGVATVMTAHVVYPAVDAENPATMSSAWIDGVLRGELGFAGVVLTDDLEMGAIVNEGGIGAACVRAVRAGVDGLLICHRLDRMEEAVTALRAEADRDPAFAARCAESLGRLRHLAITHRPDPVPLGELSDHIGAHGALAAELAGPQGAAADPTAFAPQA